VLLRLLLGAPDALHEWPLLTDMLSSSIIQIECLRTVERLRIVERVDPDMSAFQRNVIMSLLRRMQLADVSDVIVRRAGYPMPFALKTLDAIHLVTAMKWREESGDLAFATHDAQLGKAARAMAFPVLGV